MIRISTLLIALISLFPMFLSAQGKQGYIGEWYQRKAEGKAPVQSAGFEQRPSDFANTKRYKLKANLSKLNSIQNTEPDLLNLTVPYGDKIYTLNLAKVEVVGDDFNVNTSEGNKSYERGVQYRGIVDSNPAHIASMSITKTDKSVFFSTSEGNFTVTKEGTEYIVYNDQEQEELPITINCETPDAIIPITFDPNLISGIGCKTVGVYFECDYAFYQSKGSNITTLTDYVIGFFNQVATLYANEDIAIQIASMFVWTIPDPYVSLMTPSAILTPFRLNTGTSFTGNLAHFLTTRNIGGGVAFVDVLCNKPFAFGVSRIYTTYSVVPAYSWTINVVTHELGHNIGSPHTQSCTWTGGALDNCYAPEGSCSPGPPPTNGGTIMSYCHTTAYGINFNNGFGTQPGNLIRSKVSSASCISPGLLANPPTSLSTANITSTSAVLNWAPAISAGTYTIQYKLATASTWTPGGTTTTTTKTITGLTPGSSYVWTVKAECSPFAPNATFSTLTGTGGCPIPTQLTSSNITQTGATLSWSVVAAAVNYTLQFKVSSASVWTTVTAATNTHILTGLTAGTSYVWQVKANCSGYSTQSNFTTLTSSTCPAPVSLVTSNITQTGATLSWAAVSGATSYTIQYKVSTTPTWTTVTSTTNSKVITGLLAGTNYVWQVKANCSVYSSQASFTTTNSSGCAIPGQLTSSNISQTGATLSWGTVSGASSYTVQYKIATATSWTFATTTTNTLVLTGLIAGTTYAWRVKANCSNYSAQTTFTTTAASCAAPTNLTTTNITTTSAKLNWTPPASAQTHKVRIRLVGSSTWTTYSNLTGSSYTVTNLSSRSSYEWKVNTTCTNGSTSSYSALVTFTTL